MQHYTDELKVFMCLLVGDMKRVTTSSRKYYTCGLPVVVCASGHVRVRSRVLNRRYKDLGRLGAWMAMTLKKIGEAKNRAQAGERTRTAVEHNMNN